MHLDKLKSYILEPLWGGNAWATTVETYKKLDYIIDYGIGGLTDFSYAQASMKDMSKWPFEDYLKIYMKPIWPWIEKAHKVLVGGDVIRGGMYHFRHEHYFDYGPVITHYDLNSWSYPEDFERAENFSLRIKNEDMRRYFLETFK
jgi:hypothetical protein